jgi:hypothetical protein
VAGMPGRGTSWGRALGLPLAAMVAVGVALLVFLVAASAPALSLVLVGAAVVFVLLAGSLVVAALVVPAVPTRARVAVAVCAAAAVLSVVALAGTGAPARVRWAASEADFQAAVNRMREHPEDFGRESLRSQRIGAYWITDVDWHGNGVYFYDKFGWGLVDYAGFAYLPDGPEAVPVDEASFENPRYEHLDGPWYSWTASW